MASRSQELVAEPAARAEQRVYGQPTQIPVSSDDMQQLAPHEREFVKTLQSRQGNGTVFGKMWPSPCPERYPHNVPCVLNRSFRQIATDKHGKQCAIISIVTDTVLDLPERDWTFTSVPYKNREVLVMIDRYTRAYLSRSQIQLAFPPSPPKGRGGRGGRKGAKSPLGVYMLPFDTEDQLKTATSIMSDMKEIREEIAPLEAVVRKAREERERFVAFQSGRMGMMPEGKNPPPLPEGWDVEGTDVETLIMGDQWHLSPSFSLDKELNYVQSLQQLYLCVFRTPDNILLQAAKEVADFVPFVKVETWRLEAGPTVLCIADQDPTQSLGENGKEDRERVRIAFRRARRRRKALAAASEEVPVLSERDDSTLQAPPT